MCSESGRKSRSWQSTAAAQGRAFQQEQQHRNRGERRRGQSATSSHTAWLEQSLHVESVNRWGWKVSSTQSGRVYSVHLFPQCLAQSLSGSRGSINTGSLRMKDRQGLDRSIWSQFFLYHVQIRVWVYCFARGPPIAGLLVSSSIAVSVWIQARDNVELKG